MPPFRDEEAAPSFTAEAGQRVGGGIRIWSPARIVVGFVICLFIARIVSSEWPK